MRKLPPFQEGDEFDNVVVVGFSHFDKYNREFYEVQCRCRATLFRSVTSLRRPSYSSCRACIAVQEHTTHGKTGTPEYRAYTNARGRCNNPSNPKYPRYGGRGIEFRFEAFEDFYAELGDKPGAEYSVDRINNDGHYEPGNVRWATRRTQRLNSSLISSITVDGVRLFIPDIVARTGLTTGIACYRIRQGMCNVCILKGKRRVRCTHKGRENDA